MWVRVTIDPAFNIVDIEAVTDSMPYPASATLGPDYRKLIGANLVEGSRKRLHDLMGHTKGCTHITEMLANVPTAAIQTFAGPAGARTKAPASLGLPSPSSSRCQAGEGLDGGRRQVRQHFGDVRTAVAPPITSCRCLRKPLTRLAPTSFRYVRADAIA